MSERLTDERLAELERIFMRGAFHEDAAELFDEIKRLRARPAVDAERDLSAFSMWIRTISNLATFRMDALRQAFLAGVAYARAGQEGE